MKKNRVLVARRRPANDKKYGQCPLPDCSNHVMVGGSLHGMCPVHEKFLSDLLYFLPRIEMHDDKATGLLILPGTKEFAGSLPKKEP